MNSSRSMGNVQQNVSIEQVEADMHAGKRILPSGTLEVLAVVFSLAIAIGAVGNLLVIVAYCRDIKLRNTYNIYLLNLAVSDMCVVCISMTLFLGYTVNNCIWPFGRLVCKLWMSVDYVACQVSVLLVVVVAWDRLIMVRHGLRYSILETRSKARKKVAVCWAWAILLNVPIVWLWDVVRGYSVIPDTACHVEYHNNVAFTVAYVVVEFGIPLVFLACCNLRLFFAIKNSSDVIREKRSSTEGNVSIKNDYRFPSLSSQIPDKWSSINLTPRRPEITFSEKRSGSHNQIDVRSATHGAEDAVAKRLPMQELVVKTDDAGHEFTSARHKVGWPRPSDVLERRSTELKGILKERFSNVPAPELQTDQSQAVPWMNSSEDKLPSPSRRPTVLPDTQSDPARASISERRQTQGSILSYGVAVKRNRQAAFKLSLLVLVLVVSWVPYCVAFIMISICSTSCVDPYVIDYLSWLVWIRSCVNPFLYACSSPRFRKSIKRLFGISCPCTPERDNRRVGSFSSESTFFV